MKMNEWKTTTGNLHFALPGLSYAVDSSDCLQLVCWVERGLNKQYVRGLHDVEPVGTRLKGQQQHGNTRIVFELLEVFLSRGETLYIITADWTGKQQLLSPRSKLRNTMNSLLTDTFLTWKFLRPFIYLKTMSFSSSPFEITSKTSCHW